MGSKDEKAALAGSYIYKYAVDATCTARVEPEVVGDEIQRPSMTMKPKQKKQGRRGSTGGERIEANIQEFRHSLRVARTDSRDSNGSRSSACCKKDDCLKKKRLPSIRFMPTTGSLQNMRRRCSTMSPTGGKGGGKNAVWGNSSKKSRSRQPRSQSMGANVFRATPTPPVTPYLPTSLSASTPPVEVVCDTSSSNFAASASTAPGAGMEDVSQLDHASRSSGCMDDTTSSEEDPCSPHQETTTWTCTICTFVNEPMHLVCGMCGEAKKTTGGGGCGSSGGKSGNDDEKLFDSAVLEVEEHYQCNREFQEYQRSLASIRPSSWIKDKLVFDYDGCNVYLEAGERKDVHWMDIFMQVNITPQDMLKASKHLLKLNMQMAAASPIPIWFAMDDDDNILFVNRMNWERMPTELLDQHITRCIERMTMALLAEGIDVMASSASSLHYHHHHYDGRE